MKPRDYQGPVQRTLAGFLGLLDLRGSEVIPNSIAGFMQPSVEMTPFLQGGTQQLIDRSGLVAIITTSATFQGTTIPLAVPQGETWFVWRASAICNLGAADSIEAFGLALRTTGGAGIGVVALASQVGPWVQPFSIATAVMDRPLILTSGMELGITYSGIVMAAAETFVVSALVSVVRGP